jgi:prephenate dehydratase
MKAKKIGIQGQLGSNHHLAVQELYTNENYDLESYQDFISLAEDLAAKKIDCAVMAVHNSIAGNVPGNYELIERYKFTQIAQLTLPIHNCLIGFKDAVSADIKQVHSHPVALKQCIGFIDEFTLDAHEHHDTAGAVPFVLERNEAEKRKDLAALAPAIAAEIYGGKVLAANVESLYGDGMHIKNETTFWELVR